MDSGFVRTLIALVIFIIQGFYSITGLTLCDNTKKTHSLSQSNFPRSDICNDRPSCVDGKRCSFAKLSCRPGYSIYDPEVQGLHSSEIGTCTGQTIHLLIDTTECYWTNACTVKFPEVPIIVKHLDGDEDCRGKCIHAVHVRKWQCIKDTVIHQMCDDSTSFILGQTVDGRQGVVRSHEDWPFQYNNHVVPGGVTECNKTFHPHLSGVSDGFTRLALSVVFLDIRPQYETLRAVSDSKVVVFKNTDKSAVHVFPEGKKVVLSLRKVGGIYKKERQLGRSGFVICFRFLKKGESPRGDDVCGDVFKPNRKDAKCVNCKYRKRGKKIREYCGGDIPGVRVYNVTLANSKAKKQIKDGCSPWTMVDKPCKKRKKPLDKRRPKVRRRTRKKKKNRGQGKKRGGSRG
ncbi:uncharacterized protein LOC110442274 [Mizuhopecten yessoensis]|uniref:uncharacterized protein LOC110442274 n=1 Tax=Mizuhopecten yessoensis TaxID=6573 RepID=UPI000B45EF23|nr:uncharacterized protein LOC110442274 [Mizuhopecten yessoensis]